MRLDDIHNVFVKYETFMMTFWNDTSKIPKPNSSNWNVRQTICFLVVFKLYKPVHNGQIYNWYQWSSVYNELNWKKCYCYNNLNYTKICAILVKQIKKYVALFRFEIKQMNESKLNTKWFYLWGIS